jgi:hypothetical protein
MERPGRGGAERNPELRGIAGSGPSKVGVDGAMRARDVSRPSPAELAGAVAAAAARLAGRPAGGARPGRPAPPQEGSGGRTPVDS